MSKISENSKGQNGTFWGFKMTYMYVIDFTKNYSGRKIAIFPHCNFRVMKIAN